MMDEKEHHETIHEYHSHVSGLLSSKTKDLYEAGTTDTVRGSLISGNETHMESGRDMTITGSAVISSKDANLLAGRNFKADSTEERSGSTYRESVKKRGLLSGGGLGFTMGSEKRKGRYDSEAVEQVGSTIGSVEGSVRISAGKDADIEASRVSAGKDLAVRGKNVTITSKDNVYTNKEEHEYKRSGLSVSLGGSFVSGVNSVIQPLQKSGDVQDGRLKNLYMADAGMNGRTAIRNFDSAGKVKAGLAVDVGFSSVSSTSKASSYETQAQSSTLTAKEKADIRGGENLSIQGSTIQGKDVDLEAEKDIRLTAAENKSEMDIHEKTKNGGISTSWGIGGLSGVKVYGQSAKGMENAASLTHTASEVSAENTLHVSGGNDTIMTGSRMEGGKVVLATGGSLRIESLQDTESYKSRSNVKGGALASDVFKDSAGHKKLDKPYLSAETARGYTDSDYASVKEQAGIYAGQEGYDISVKDNTYLKGAVIDSKGSVDKNTLRTGTLSWEDIENKADYKSGGSGISYTAKLGGNVNNDTPSSRENSRYDKEPGTNTHNESDKVTRASDENRIPLNERGLLGVPTAATKGKADSTTKAAMAPGKIVITDTKNQKQDVTGLDRNTRDSLNKLKAIFDKTKAEERKQLVEEMSIVGNEAIHELAARNGWGEGSIEKTALHGLLGAMTSKAAGSSALAGILSGGVQEYAMGYLHNHMPKGWAANHPDEAQMIAAGLGMIV
ncbi:hemagglutinin repeat-containing protein, partial [Dialister succinatiphilus]